MIDKQYNNSFKVCNYNKLIKPQNHSYFDTNK